MSTLKSAPLRQQHDGLRRRMEAIRKHLNPLLLAANAVEVRQNLTLLLGELGKHLQQEAKDLYPELAACEDPATRQLAERFSLEMRAQLPELAAFNKRWPSAEAIRANATLFLKEADEQLKWLQRRLADEGHHLLPLLDKLDVAGLAIHRNPELKIARI